MPAREAARRTAERLSRDLRLGPASLSVTVIEDDEGYLGWRFIHGSGPSGALDAGVHRTDEVGSYDQELLALQLAEALENEWPDEMTDPWPPCPAGADHPLMPTLVRGRAVWRCWRSHDIDSPIGDLASESGS